MKRGKRASSTKVSVTTKRKASNKKQKFYITTAIDYVNAEPHIGHALEKVQADALARFHGLLGHEVFFLTGTDEHGTKVYRASQEAGLPPQEFCDKITEKFVELTKALDTNNDDFIRTTDKQRHWPGAQKLWELCKKDIVKRKYRGLYCVGCEAFLLERDLDRGLCPIHKKKPESLEEENYFFLLSRYTDRIREILESDEYRVVPESRKNEVLALVREGLQDVSVSRPRRTLPWGIPVPNDPDHVFYVWFDALPNYITAIGFGRDEKTYRRWWPADVHVIGKDILRFHAVLWPGMLLSAGLPLPKTLFVHGYMTVNGEKMSKSLGNVIDPRVYTDGYGSDALRYFLLAGMPSQEDGDFTHERFVDVYNTALADDLGNLVMRTATLLVKYLGGRHPQTLGDTLQTSAESLAEDYIKHFEAFEIDKACAAVWTLVRATNRYLNESEPWRVAKENPERLEQILYNVTESLRFLSVLLEPIIPKTAAKIREQFGFPEPSLKDLEWGTVLDTKVKETPPLFPKIVEEKEEPFASLDLRVARVASVEDHPDAEKLYVLRVDLGGTTRQLVAGLRAHYKKEELLGRKIIILTNLAPAKIRGVASQGMLLAGDDGKSVGILFVEKAEPGIQVTTANVKSSPRKQISLEDFQKIRLVVRRDNVYYKDSPLVADRELVRVERVLEGAKVR